MNRYQIYCIYLFIAITVVSSADKEEVAQVAKIAGLTVADLREKYAQTIHQPLTNLAFWDTIINLILWIAELIW